MTLRCLDCSTRPQETKDGLCAPCQADRWDAYRQWRADRDAAERSGQTTLGGWA